MKRDRRSLAKSGRAEDRIYSLGRLGLHRGKDVGVRVERDPDARVSQAFRHDLGMYALLEHQGRVRVSQVMEADRRQPRTAKRAPPSSRERVRVHRSPVGIVHHEIVLHTRA